MTFISSEKTLRRFLNNATRIAKPTATSAAATVIMKKTKMLPSRFKDDLEKVTKAKLIPLSMSSKDISISKRFLRKRTPRNPMEKRHSERTM
tara:strand:- start:324 stop:599 length:276 start_codon:yes stop_codon:yes gene_type:complete